MKSTEIRVERFSVVSSKSFEETLAGLYAGIGRPAMSSLAPKLAAAKSFAEFEQLVNGAVGSADLMEFLRLDLGMALRKDPAATAYKMIRIIAGNPLISTAPLISRSRNWKFVRTASNSVKPSPRRQHEIREIREIPDNI
jgi:hypothetical protein